MKTATNRKQVCLYCCLPYSFTLSFCFHFSSRLHQARKYTVHPTILECRRMMEAIWLKTKSNTSPDISIHAPARGATGEYSIAEFTAMFQSTLPRGERLSCENGNYYGDWFQSTLPRGERRILNVNIMQPRSFNPRSRAGND